MNFNQKYNRACKEYENSDLYKRKSTQLKHLSMAKDLVEDCLVERPENYRCWYLLGLIWYNFSFGSEERNLNCEKALKNAINIKPDDNWANMYLGHLYFDQRKFDIALTQFEKLNSKYFDELDLHWRVLKYEELILCCRFFLNFEQVDYSEIEKYAKSCEKSVKLDEYEYVFPLEMMRCLVELSENSKTDKSILGKIFFRLKKMLRKTDNEKVFREDILKIESNL